MTTETKATQVTDIPEGYAQRVIDELYENGDPVSVDAAELLTKMLSQPPAGQQDRGEAAPSIAVCAVCGQGRHVAAHRPILSGPHEGEPLDHAFTVATDVVSVPRVPTSEMLEAAFRVRATMFHDSEDEKNTAAYSAMVAASPPPAPQREPLTGWQSMKTAPTSRPIILLWRTAPWPLRGEWSIDEEFDTRPKGWVSPGAGWRNDGDQCIPRNQEDCIAWQDLPAAHGIKEGS